MPDDESSTMEQRLLEELQSHGLNEEKAKDALADRIRYVADYAIQDALQGLIIKDQGRIIDKLKSLSEGQEELSKRSNWQSWLIILIAAATLLLYLLTALHLL